MPVRAPFPTFFNFVLFTVIFLRFLQFLKAFFPIEVTFFPIVTLFKFLQPSKLLAPISVIVSGITMLCSFLLFLNAFAAMPVTWYSTLSTVTVFGIVTFFAFFSLADSFVSVTDGFPLEESDFVTLVLRLELQMVLHSASHSGLQMVLRMVAHLASDLVMRMEPILRSYSAG